MSSRLCVIALLAYGALGQGNPALDISQGIAAEQSQLSPVPGSPVLDSIRQSGIVRCAVDATPGFSSIDVSGLPYGFDVDFCRAIAAAVLGNATLIDPRRISTSKKFEALVRGEVDVAFGMTTWTFQRERDLAVSFPVVMFYDTQSFMVWADRKIQSLEDIKGHRVCVQRGSTSEENLTDFNSRHTLGLTLVELATTEEKINAFAEGRCGVVTGDRSELAANAALFSPGKGQWQILQETISDEPLSPVVVAKDRRWATLVRWVVQVTLLAEKYGLSLAAVPPPEDTMPEDLRRLLGADPGFGAALGLDGKWARRVIAQVGSYKDIFERNLVPLGLSRGINALRRDGGAFIPLPLR